jgi:signal transduction histidine kinase
MDTGIEDLGSPCGGRAITNDGLNRSVGQGTLATHFAELSPVIEAPPRVRIGGWRPTRFDVVSVCAALVLVLGFAHPAAYRVPSMRAAVETVMTLFGLAAAALVAEQFRQTRRQRKLVLFGTLVTLALIEFVANALPAALQLHSSRGLAGVYAFGQVLVAAGFVLAARTPSNRVALQLRRPLLTTALLSLAACGLTGVIGWLLRGQLIGTSRSESGLQQALGHPLAFALLIGTAALYVWAAAEFARRGQLERSQVLPLLGEGVLLLAAARLYYLALPGTSPLEISLREGLRLVAFGLIFSAMLRRELEIRAGAARAAALAERHRVAQDLHDGLAQDLAFIAAHWSTLGEDVDQEHPVMRAARHALAISRNTISELSNAESASTTDTLDVIAHELGDRFGVRVMTDVAPDATLARDVRDQVGRITREAVANAVRHGQARHVLVTLKRGAAGTVLRVVDDGRGIRERFSDADEGFGIRTMRDRAAALGGTLDVRRKARHGTELEVTIP